nr:hypothetical protein Milk-S104_00072 [Bovine alphaherpesvirus 1]WHT50290.1 hypothetical protein Milk-S104_00086 [Bovine alphaherpesvirus 1]WHT50367.1 hypothetical protein Docile-S101_00075 [Bovine alphaherpesvirus 1]WHT50381.1 hypothetical protein Docile-S101_00089 [Bovine alphaherpesvirus 1]
MRHSSASSARAARRRSRASARRAASSRAGSSSGPPSGPRSADSMRSYRSSVASSCPPGDAMAGRGARGSLERRRRRG